MNFFAFKTSSSSAINFPILSEAFFVFLIFIKDFNSFLILFWRHCTNFSFENHFKTTSVNIANFLITLFKHSNKNIRSTLVLILHILASAFERKTQIEFQFLSKLHHLQKQHFFPFGGECWWFYKKIAGRERD